MSNASNIPNSSLIGSGNFPSEISQASPNPMVVEAEGNELPSKFEEEKEDFVHMSVDKEKKNSHPRRIVEDVEMEIPGEKGIFIDGFHAGVQFAQNTEEKYLQIIERLEEENKELKYGMRVYEDNAKNIKFEQQQKIDTLMHKILRLEKPRKKTITTWQWQANDFDCAVVFYEPYPSNISLKIEKLRFDDYLVYTANNGHTYRLVRTGTDDGFQINLSAKNNTKRLMCRTVEKFRQSKMQYPLWWTSISVSEMEKYHYQITRGINNNKNMDVREGKYGEFSADANLSGHWSNASLMPMDLEINAKALEVAHIFFATVKRKKYRITQILSVENPKLWESYNSERWSLLKDIGRNKLNERQLFHGTDDVTIDAIVVNGFCRDYSKKGVYGNGTNFASDAKYSVSYTHADSNGVHEMLFCNVLCGESIVGGSQYTLNSWPKKRNHVLYDSLVDKLNDPNIFVIHNDRRIYPLFIIQFMLR